MVSIKHGRDLDHEIQSQRKELEQEVEKHNQHDDLLRSLADDKTQLTKLEQECFTFADTIVEKRSQIEKKKLEIEKKKLFLTPQSKINERKKYINQLESFRNGRSEHVQWKGYPVKLDQQILEKYLQKFRNLPQYIHQDIRFLNITMFGGVGVGKSSFLNSVATALKNDPNGVCKDYATAPSRTGKSKTSTFQLKIMTVGGTKNLPIRFYDCPGIDQDEDETMNLDVLEAIINGHVKGDSQFDPNEIRNKTGESFRRDPTFNNVMHCLVFVIKASTNLQDPHNETLEKIKAIQRRVNASRDVKQFAVVTNIDKIGVHTMDMENVFRYKCVKDICETVSTFLGLKMQSVFPVANYNEEIYPNVAKSTLSLMALSNIVEFGKRHIYEQI